MNSLKNAWAVVKQLVAWCKSVVSEQDGLGSASRVVKLAVVGSCAFCLVFVTVRTGQLPDADKLRALAEVIGMGSAAYAANMLKNAIGKKDGD